MQQLIRFKQRYLYSDQNADGGYKIGINFSNAQGHNMKVHSAFEYHDCNWINSVPTT